MDHLETTAAAEAAAPQEAITNYEYAGGGQPEVTSFNAKAVQRDTYNEPSPESSSLTSSQTGSHTLPAGRKLIRDVSMDVETDQFDTLLSGLQTSISEIGGYVEQSDISGNSLNYYGEPIPRYANLTVRIPIDRIDSFITTVEANGNVINKSESTQDVTLQYSDIESKKKSLEIEQERIWTFLEKAESIDTVITLEERLSEIRYQLESMESQLRLYDNQVEYSTVYLSISEVTSFTPTAPESAGARIKNGFADNFTAFSTAMTNLLIGLITTSPFWLPLLVLIWLIYLILKKKIRRLPPELPERKKDQTEKSQEENQ